ncbi:MAG: TetR/AcrR family transcriptional regulator [Flexilinea sp.]|nr:TetR/AcrR family transcriptional regulator [Flexilinea sp.]
MAPKIKITKEMVAQAAFELIRAVGHEALNARSIAEHLGCSTQPVLYNFKTVDEIRAAAYEIADDFHTAYIKPKEMDENPMLALGMNYVRFGHEEKNLFRFLFQTNKFGGMDVAALISDPNLSGVLDVIAGGLQCSEDTAREMFLTFFCVVHGLASLLANNAMDFDEKKCVKMLENVFFGMTAFRKGKADEKTL